uniref:Uncharacterized protein n=1 Tax=Mimivirus LCMiAC01 TaxID=2506608 RepID=A0A481Z1G7_9VIRU|nr:MAG: hypothetical protein LCMiAC01_02920 [Mimivirus LCMiAC01]
MSRYHSYQLTYPHEGKTIYRIGSIEKAAKKCYKEFKYLTDIKEGMFGVTDLDTDAEYYFRAKNKKLYQVGGQYYSTNIMEYIKSPLKLSKEYISYPINNILTHSETDIYNKYKNMYDEITSTYQTEEPLTNMSISKSNTSSVLNTPSISISMPNVSKSSSEIQPYIHPHKRILRDIPSMSEFLSKTKPYKFVPKLIESTDNSVIQSIELSPIKQQNIIPQMQTKPYIPLND